MPFVAGAAHSLVPSNKSGAANPHERSMHVNIQSPITIACFVLSKVFCAGEHVQSENRADKAGASHLRA